MATFSVTNSGKEAHQQGSRASIPARRLPTSSSP
jgi:hypothetical protein